MCTKETKCDSKPQESRNGCRKLLFGDGTVEDTLDGGPSVSDSNWWVVSTSQQIVNEFPGMWTRPACGLKNERDQIDVWVPVEFGLLRSLGHKSWFYAGSRNQRRTAREGSNNETSKYVTDPLRLKTRSMRACSVCPLTTRVRAGTSCSINALTPLCV